MGFEDLSSKKRFAIGTGVVVLVAAVLIWISSVLQLGFDLAFRFVMLLIAFVAIGVIWDRIFIHNQTI